MSNAVRRQLIKQALHVWAPDWPRNVNRQQTKVSSAPLAAEHLLQAEEEQNNSPFISVYSFPRGHTKEGNIPNVNTLFIDFDFDEGDYVRGSGDRDAWRRDMSQLLVRVRRVAEVLQEHDNTAWRASLSGHKGIHLYLDFPTIGPDTGTFGQFISGMNEYANGLVEMLEDETGISDLSEYVDVTSSDLGRLCRVPNTLHKGATRSFGEERYCVPVTIDELTSMTPRKYEVYTSGPRDLPWDERTQSENAREVLTQHIANAVEGAPSSRGHSSTVNRALVREYKESSNENISLDDIEYLISDRPCVWEFHKREDKYDYGYQSHYMEIFCMQELIERNVPIEVMKKFFENSPKYDEVYTENKIEQIISRDYSRFSMDKLRENAPEFLINDN